VQELIAQGVRVTLLTRSDKQSARGLPNNEAAVKVVDYESLDELKAALEGQDAVVSTIADTRNLQNTGEEKLSNGDFFAFRDLLGVYLHRDGDGHSIPEAELANGLLELPQDNLRDSVRKWLSAGSLSRLEP
jgi:hypothetical protein